MESESESLSASKSKFVNLLKFQDSLQQVIYMESKLPEWQNATSVYSIATMIRSICQQGNRDVQSQFNKTSTSANPRTTSSDAMDCNNISKVCALSTCKKSFTTKNPYFKYCSVECNGLSKSQIVIIINRLVLKSRNRNDMQAIIFSQIIQFRMNLPRKVSLILTPPNNNFSNKWRQITFSTIRFYNY